MTFLSPIWLLGLLPWAVVVASLFAGKRAREQVPFLALWAGPSASSPPERARTRPPLFKWILVLAMFLAVLAAAGPQLPGGRGAQITIILDRGITMSPLNGDEPFRGVVASAETALAKNLRAASVDLVHVPGPQVRTNLQSWAAIARDSGPTAADTQSLLDATVTGELRISAGPILVLSDRRLASESDRLVQISPAAAVVDVGIDLLAARDMPAPQVMIRVLNRSSAGKTTVVVTSGEQQIERKVSLPPGGKSRDFFFDFTAPLAETARARISTDEIADRAVVNDRAWLARERSWPIIEARTALPAAVGRMIQTYARLRPGGSASAHVAVADHELPAGESGVWIVGGSPNQDAAGDSAVKVSPHALTSVVDRWPRPADRSVKAPGGFDIIVSTGEAPLLAIKDAPQRQVWLNADVEHWSREPAFVVFFTNAFNWAGGDGNGEFVAHPVAQLGQEWTRVDDSPAPRGTVPGVWPGLYRRTDSVLKAVNAPPVSWGTAVPGGDWRQRLDRALSAGGVGVWSLRPLLCLAAMFAACAGVFLAARQRNRAAKFFPAQDRSRGGVSTTVAKTVVEHGASRGP